jgi:hypothetical protein
VHALENDDLIHETPAIVGCQTPSALAHRSGGGVEHKDPEDL